jgi:AcrR family transcriptional regulator
MTPMDEQTSGRRPVGRGQKVRKAVLAATLLELADRGYAGLSIEDVARRAGVNKTTVYRRWGDRQSLVIDTLTDEMAVVTIPDTGTIEGDLRAWALALIRALTSPVGQAMVNTMLIGGADIPEVADAKRRFFDERLHRAQPMIVRAIQRGELPPGTGPIQLLKTVIAPIYLQLLVTAEPIGETTADLSTAVALAAARAGALSPSGDHSGVISESPEV